MPLGLSYRASPRLYLGRAWLAVDTPLAQLSDASARLSSLQLRKVYVGWPIKSIRPMSALGQKQTFGDTTRKVRSWGLSGRNRRESGHRHSNVRCWGQSECIGDMVEESVVSQ